MTQQSQTGLVYEQVRAAILALEILPGERVSERGLEAEYGASRTPVRAALSRLQSEGLVMREGRGWLVTPIDLSEVRALTEFRAAVEAAGARLACERAHDDDLAVFAREAHDRADDPGDEIEGMQRGTDFHVGLAHLSGNTFIEAAVQDAVTRMARVRWLEMRTAEGRGDAWREHAAIVEAVTTRNADAAASAIAHHSRENLARLLASLRAERRVLGARGLRIVGE